MSTVFYSWQSDLPATRDVIKSSLEQAIRNLNRDLNIEEPLRLDQDTQNVAGWPDITSVIFEKIAECTVVVADITPINGPESEFKLTPNPNVLLELGYALGTGLRRTRIICVVNTCYLPNGDVKELPFDLRGSRPIIFEVEDTAGHQAVKDGQHQPARSEQRERPPVPHSAPGPVPTDPLKKPSAR